MAHGPTIIFDKSAIQKMSPDEADWLNHFFRPVLTPIYLAELKADLAKEQGRKAGHPETMVAALASKTRGMGTMANVPYLDLILGELMGNRVEMRGVPIVDGARNVTADDGSKGLVLGPSPESETLRRWERGHFSEDEHEDARQHRRAAKGINLEPLIRATNNSRPHGAKRFSSLRELAAAIDKVLSDETAPFRALKMALNSFNLAPVAARLVRRRWAARDRPSLQRFAPYTYFCTRLSMLFHHGVGEMLITQRPTNLLDMEYLYYLPFCQVFTSADNLHMDMAPLVMTPEQRFVGASDLKSAIAAIAAHYYERREELKGVGRMNYAEYPPLDMNGTVHELYDVIQPGWRKRALTPQPPLTPEAKERLLAHLKPMREAIARMDRRGQ